MTRRSRRCKACETCRIKKVKCDELQPECSRCRRAGEPCPGPIQGSIFINTGPLGHSVQQEREQIPYSAHGEASQSANETEHGVLPLSKYPGQGRADPFSTLARRTTARENFLLDFYISDIMKIFGGSLDMPFHPPRDICFGVNITGVASMEVMFAFAAKHLARWLGHPDIEARRYEILAFRRIHEAIADPSRRFHSSTILAIMGRLHYLYQLQRESQEINAHILGIRYLVKGRGGFPAICDDPSLCWMAIVTDLLTYGAISAGGTPLSQHALSWPGSTLTASVYGSNTSARTCSYPFDLLVEEYTGTFRNFFLEAQTRKSRSLSKLPEDSCYFYTTRIFRRGSSFHRILTNSTSIGVPRICVLFLFNSILWDHRHDLRSLFSDDFKAVRIGIVGDDSHIEGSMDILLWSLITDPKTHKIDSVERMWLLARLLRIHNQLSKYLQLQLEDALLHFLDLDDRAFDLSIDLENFRLTVLRDLQISQDKSASGEGETNYI